MNHHRTAVPLVLVVACLALAACQDGLTEVAAPEASAALMSVAPSSIAPDSGAQQAVAALDPTAARLEGLRDALARAQPALATDARAAAIAVALRQAIAALEREDGASASRALQGAEQALERYTRRGDDAMSPDLEAIRLAVAAATTR